MNEPATTAHGNMRHQLGTFAGVFTPSVLAILGIIMFLRANFVVGQAGVSGALMILLTAEVLVILTALSVAAISTNTPVRGGGAYYLISRVLGPEFGGAIGLALFLAQTISVPFYILGFGEAFVQNVPVLAPHLRWLCLGTATVLFVLNYIGVRWALSMQFLVMATLGLAMLVFFGGAAIRFDPELLAANWEPRYGEGFAFWRVFAIYFPAVTGIMAGINMSGDLKDPGRSLVRGTFWAIAVGAAVYALHIVLFGGAVTRDNLIEYPYASLVHGALFSAGFLVAAGMCAASLSSALSSFVASPRVMQAIARDRILPPLSFLAAGTRKGDEPRRAIVLAFGIGMAVLWWATAEDAGDAFNTVASVVTMFFLSTYTIINLAAFVEAFGSNPSFRPRFQFFHWSTALAGAAGCLAVMGLIDWVAASIAMLCIGLLYAYMSRRVYVTTFGDARRGFVYSHLSKNLLRLRNFHPHPKNWRPTILVLSGDPETRLNLISFGVWLEAGRGIVTVAQLITGTLEQLLERRNAALKRLEAFVQENDLNVFPEVVVAGDFDEGVRLLLQSHSIGPIKPNIVLMGWPNDPERVAPFVRHLHDIRKLGMSAVAVVDHGLPSFSAPKRVDIWWRGQENGSLMLILAHLLEGNWEWSNSDIRILRLIDQEDGREPAARALRELVEAARITAEVCVLVSGEPFPQVFREHSHDASLIFVGFQPVDETTARSFFDFYETLLGDMPTTVLVSSSGEADLLA